jgi:transposase InsO family protein
VTGILKRHGLIDTQRSCEHQPWQRYERPEPNDLWQMDFKGHFATGPQRCHPLTVLDDHSRYCITLQACTNERGVTVQQCLSESFACYGLPWQMLMDNGSPWGSDTPHALTPLTVWLTRLGISTLHGRAYHPQTQGKDERFHRTLEDELLRYHTFKDVAHCQRGLQRWREIYNFDRPHESLHMQVPAQRYRPSTRAFPRTLPPIEYASSDEVRKVNGKHISFQGRTVRICKALHGYPVALRPTTTDGLWQVYFCHHRVTIVDLRISRK